MTCLDLSQLDAYLSGTLTEPEYQTMSRHLEECAACGSMLDEVKQNAALLARVRRAAHELHPKETAPVGGRTFGSYRLLEEIGRGGMGVVFLAEQSNPIRRVALKLVPPSLATPEVLQRFQTEAQILGSLKHPGIAGIYEAGVRETILDGQPVEQPYFAMEYVRGDRLDIHIRERNPGRRQRLLILAQICDAVHHAHTRGIIHRDLKPGNLIIEETPGDHEDGCVQPKILDFGVARNLQPDLHTLTMHTESGRLLGTVPFMSPEQVSGAITIDTRSDIYSIGVLGYWLLTGRLPYDLKDRSLPESARIITEETPVPASAADASLRGDVDVILAKALAKEPERRYGSASELAEDIRRHLRNEPVSARAPSAWYQLSRFTRRNPALVTTMLALLAVTLTGGAVATVLAVRSKRAEEQARREQQAAMREAATATAINEFLLKVLSSADPYAEWGGRDVTVAAALDIAAAQLEEGNLSGQPATELAVRHTVGNAYRTLGDYRKAQQQFERAIHVHDSAFGEMAREAISVRNDLAAIYARQGDFRRAEAAAGQALAAARAAADLEAETQSLGNLSAFLAEQGRYADAESAIVLNIEVLRELHGTSHSEIAINLNNLGVLRSRLGLNDDSRSTLTEALAMQTHLAGDRHPLTLNIMHSLGRTLVAAGDLDRAEPLLRDVLAAKQSVQGRQHPDVPAVQTSLALALIRKGELPEAASLIDSALALSREIFGANHPTTARALAAAGELRFREGDLAAADLVFSEAEVAFREVLGDGHSFVAEVLHERAVIAALQTDYSGAESQFVEAWRIRRATLGSNSPLTFITNDSLISLYAQWGRPVPDSLRTM